jgi:hypothetical protein
MVLQIVLLNQHQQLVYITMHLVIHGLALEISQLHKEVGKELKNFLQFQVIRQNSSYGYRLMAFLLRNLLDGTGLV